MFKWARKLRRSLGPVESGLDQAVFITLYGFAIEDRYRNSAELSNFTDRLQMALGNEGQVQPIESAADVVIITVLGESADGMYRKIGTLLRHVSVARNAHVLLRYGPSGSLERRTHMAN